MARIVVIGAGVGGLTTASVLARDGHGVTVLERDPAPPPLGSAHEAWNGWDRRGVNQFRMLHYFLPRFRLLLDAELPDVVVEADNLGALRHNPIVAAPAEVTGGVRPGDEQFDALTARRPVMEAALARAAEQTDGVAIRRGVAVVGLATGEPRVAGVPHVVGVHTDEGERLDVDLVIDTSGRRSPLPGWLDAIGARPPEEELEDCGFVYYGRYFRSADGELPFAFGPPLQHYDSVSVLTLPADNGTWGVGFITSARDAAARRLRDVDKWSAALKQFPLVAHWADGEPLDDEVAIMAKIEDRHRSFVVDGRPVATGVVAVADSWACTNPSVGRGATIGFLHARALRDLLRACPLDDSVGLATAWHDATLREVEPWYRATLTFDRHRLAEIEAQARGERYETDDPEWELTQAMGHVGGQDPDVMRASIRIAGLLATPDEVLAEPGLLDRVMELGQGWRDAPTTGPDRAELVATLAR
ncbi:MAG TPA: FAD-dependent oxidoreductase [Acidimicrobiia bacterium]